MNICPVCGYDDLFEPPRTPDGGGSLEICASCGFQFGVSDLDEGYTDESWRAEWIRQGTPWSSVGIPRPSAWDPVRQLARIGFALDGRRLHET
jgi:hypothetical protein